jgi:hypothetical protein
MKATYYRLLVSAVAVTASIAFTGVASAQVVSAPAGPVNVTTTQTSTGITPGSTGTNFGTIMLSANNGGSYTITSLPITVTPRSGASVANLMGCVLRNGSGTTLTSGNNMVNTIGSGTNIFTLDTPLAVSGATTTLSVNCNVTSSAVSGTTFGFVAGVPNLSPSLGVTVSTIPSVPAGTQDAILGIFTLNGIGSGSNINVASLPITISENGATQADITNCSLHKAGDIMTALNTGNNAVNTLLTNGGVTTFTFNTPFSVPSGAGELVVLSCNVASVTPAGSRITVAITPSGVVATNASNGSYITPTTSMNNNSSDPVSGTITITSANSTGGTTTPPSTTVPGAPNTGAGGNAGMNYILLAISAVVLFVAASALAIKKNY